MAAATPSASSDLDALESAILTSIQTLNNIDEFALPSEQPDNHGLGVNL